MTITITKELAPPDTKFEDKICAVWQNDDYTLCGFKWNDPNVIPVWDTGTLPDCRECAIKLIEKYSGKC